MYQIDEKDKVIELKDIPQSSVGAPLPIVLSSESKTLLAYLLEDRTENWDGLTVRGVNYNSDSEPIAIVEFIWCRSFMFGSPGDETFSGHPLYERGLRPYAVSEVENSSWIRKLERMNAVHPYHKPENFEKYKHFVFAFHDSTFECVAESFNISIHRGSMESAVTKMQEKLFSSN